MANVNGIRDDSEGSARVFSPQSGPRSSPTRGKQTTVSTMIEDRLRRALKNMLDNTPADATPRPVREEAEAAVKA